MLVLNDNSHFQRRSIFSFYDDFIAQINGVKTESFQSLSFEQCADIFVLFLSSSLFFLKNYLCYEYFCKLKRNHNDRKTMSWNGIKKKHDKKKQKKIITLQREWNKWLFFVFCITFHVSIKFLCGKNSEFRFEYPFQFIDQQIHSFEPVERIIRSLSHRTLKPHHSSD